MVFINTVLNRPLGQSLQQSGFDKKKKKITFTDSLVNQHGFSEKAVFKADSDGKTLTADKKIYLRKEKNTKTI